MSVLLLSSSTASFYLLLGRPFTLLLNSVAWKTSLTCCSSSMCYMWPHHCLLCKQWRIFLEFLQFLIFPSTPVFPDWPDYSFPRFLLKCVKMFMISSSFPESPGLTRIYQGSFLFLFTKELLSNFLGRKYYTLLPALLRLKHKYVNKETLANWFLLILKCWDDPFFFFQLP